MEAEENKGNVYTIVIRNDWEKLLAFSEWQEWGPGSYNECTGQCTQVRILPSQYQQLPFEKHCLYANRKGCQKYNVEVCIVC